MVKQTWQVDRQTYRYGQTKHKIKNKTKLKAAQMFVKIENFKSNSFFSALMRVRLRK